MRGPLRVLQAVVSQTNAKTEATYIDDKMFTLF